MAVKAADRKAAGKRKTKAGAANRGQKKGQGALKAGSAFQKSNASSKQNRTAPNGTKRVKDGSGVHFRSESTIRRVQMYRTKGELSKEVSTKPMRIQPDRRWFGNTRVIAQDKMQAFRETLSKGVEDPFSVVLKSSKLPMSLLRDTEGKASRMKLLEVEPYSEVFGKGRRQKRVKMGCSDLEGLLQAADKKAENYNEAKDKQIQMDVTTAGYDARVEESGAHHGEEIFLKGTSKRIWGELYKVVDASDVLVFVIDARDPMGTRNLKLEREIRKNHPNKHIVLLMNKVDLVPTWVSRRWIQVLMKEFPTLAFHASITNPFGKNSLLNLLRQFGNLLKEAKHVTIGMLGYPNVGKSSVINTMKKKKVCKAAPVPGETKVWQYIALTKKLYLLDCPGIVPLTESDFAADTAKVLKGVVRAERLDQPSDFIGEVLNRVKKQYILQRYKLPAETSWQDAEEFLSILGTKMGKLQRGGEPDLETAARIVLYDWQRGRIPFFTPPPDEAGATSTANPSSSSAPVDVEAAGDDAATTADGATTSTASSSGANASVDGAAPAPHDGQAVAEGANAAAESSAAADPARQASAVEEAEEEDDEEEEDEVAAADALSGQGAGPTVQQSLASFSEIVCAHAFDEEDMRGQRSAPSTEASASAGVGARPAGKKREAAGGAGGEAAADANGKKRAAKRRRKSSTAARGKATVSVTPGSVDWKAVTAEFEI